MDQHRKRGRNLYFLRSMNKQDKGSASVEPTHSFYNVGQCPPLVLFKRLLKCR